MSENIKIWETWTRGKMEARGRVRCAIMGAFTFEAFKLAATMRYGSMVSVPVKGPPRFEVEGIAIYPNYGIQYGMWFGVDPYYESATATPLHT